MFDVNFWFLLVYLGMAGAFLYGLFWLGIYNERVEMQYALKARRNKQLTVRGRKKKRRRR